MKHFPTLKFFTILIMSVLIIQNIKAQSITVTSPNYNESWQVNTPHYIYWISDSVSGNVKIEYTADNGSTWTTVISSYANNGSYYWTVPNTPSTSCRVRISDVLTGKTVDESNTVFEIRKATVTLSLSKPNTAETWNIGTSQTINWSQTNVAEVKIEYTINNGTTWSVISNAYPASSGYYTWTVPNTPSSRCKVRITDTNDPSVTDASTTFFSIVNSAITILTPTNGEVWTANSYNYIYWSSTGQFNYVVIEYSINNGLSWTMIVNGTNNNGKYNWLVPNTPSKQCLIRVRDYNNSSVTDVTVKPFEIKPTPGTLYLTKPNGGEKWIKGGKEYITWNSTNVSTVDLSYSTDSGATWNTIANGVGGTSYYWNPISASVSSKCLVKISETGNTSLSDISNNVFSVKDVSLHVTEPNGGETFIAGTPRYIYWETFGASAYITFEYSLDGGINWITEISGAANNGTYYWTLPTTLSSTCKIRITDYYNGTVVDESDNNFTIASAGAATIKDVKLPNGTQTINAGSSTYIYWTATNIFTVNIFYSTDNGANWISVASNISASSGSYSWNPIPNTPSCEALVKIVEAGKPSNYDASNTTFCIVNPSITLSSPNGGESWQVGTTNAITWNSQGLSAYIRLDYSIDSGKTWVLITNGISNNGTYNWPVPNIPSPTCFIRASDYYNNALKDSSNASFTITPAKSSVQLITPNCNEEWLTGSYQTISWSSQYVTNLLIDYSLSDGQTWTNITTVTASSGSYAWNPISNTPSTKARVRVRDANDTTTVDMSDCSFSITNPYVYLITPNGGEAWQGGSSQQIYWTGKTSSNYIHIKYSVDNGATWKDVANSAYMPNGYLNWSVPNTPSKQCFIKIVDVNSNTVVDSSDAPFEIMAATPTLTVSAPNNSEQWKAGDAQYISWSASYVDSLKIEYSTDNGNSWIVVNPSVNASAGSYYWSPIPNTPSDLCKIKVTSISQPTVFDVSDNVFKIYNPSITVKTPNGGEQWDGGTYKNITWTSIGASNYVTVDYSINGGSTWTNSVTTSYNPGKNLQWAVPNTPSCNALVRITDPYNVSITDVSDKPFCITSTNPIITITNPNGGENFGTNTGTYIKWTSANVTSVKIEYSTNDGVTWNTIVASTQSSSNSYYYWNVPNTPSTKCIIKISDASNTTFSDVSDGNFSIVSPSITVISPNGGNQFTGGTNEYITWTSTGTSGYCRIQYSIDFGSTWLNAVNYTANNGSYLWTVPNTPSNQCKVRVSDYYNNAIVDESDLEFSINPSPPKIVLTSPNGGEIWASMSTKSITWNVTSISFVKLEFSVNNGSTWNTIISNYPASSGSYTWPVPNIPSTTCFVRISDASNLSVTAQSNQAFSIVVPSIQITSPNGGESFVGLQYKKISWTSQGLSSYVRIEYSTDAGSSWNLASNYTLNNGSYNWLVPNTPSANCMMRISDYNNTMLMDMSDQLFEITAAPATVGIKYPNGGEVFGAGSTQYISWYSSNVSNVKLEYSTDGGSNWTTIIVSTPAANNYYNWPLPSVTSANCYVRISDVSNASIVAQSNGPFEIVNPSITVVSPNGGEQYTEGTYQTISWTTTGLSNYVKIEYSVDSGFTWIPVVHSTYNDGNQGWTVPYSATNKALVRVSDYTKPNVFDVSNAMFSINPTPPALRLNAPNGGENFASGQVATISWTSNGIKDLKLEYSTNGGSSWNTILSSIPALKGYHSWPVPPVSSANYLVRASEVGGNLIDQSDNKFTVSSPYITLTTPNGGEKYEVGKKIYIQWNSIGVSYVKIDYSTDNGVNWNTIANSVSNYSYYTWVVPNTISNTCLVKVTNNDNVVTVADESDATFEIATPTPSVTLTSPNGGQLWYVGTQYYINWYQTAVTTVKLEYSTDSGNTWNTIVSSYPSSGGFYYWPTPNKPSTNCFIRVSDATNLAVTDKSNAVFTIAEPVPSLTLTSPNGNEIWYENTYHSIYWHSNFVTHVNLHYSTDSGSTWTLIESNINNVGNYYWKVPTTLSKNCYIALTSSADVAVSDTSNAVFEIATPFVNTNTISTDSILPAKFCKLDTVEVYFTKNGVYNSGNTFTVHLSDSSGNFSYPTVIGSASDTVDTMAIRCIIPASVLNGKGYRMRVVSDKLPSTSTDNGTDITIGSPQFDFAASKLICYLPDGDVPFSFFGDTSFVASYNWTFGDGSTDTTSNPTYSYSDIGIYGVALQVTDSNGCTIKNEKTSYIRVEQLLENKAFKTDITTDISGITFVNAAKGFMSLADGNCLLTVDSGKTWTVEVTGIAAPLTNTVNVGKHWFMTGENGQITISKDGGSSWTSFVTGTTETFTSAAFSDTLNGVAVGTNGIVYNYDGASWTAGTSGISNTLNSVKVIDKKAYAVGDKGTIVHFDGTTWANQIPASNVTEDLNEVYMVDSSKGYTVGENGVILTYSGSTWDVSLSGVDVSFTSVTAHVKDTAWACSNSGIVYRTTDGGKVWERYSVGKEIDLTRIYYLDESKGGKRVKNTSRGYVVANKGGALEFADSFDEEVDVDTTGGTDTTKIGVSTNQINQSFSVYPNPANDRLIIKTTLEKQQKMSITLKDIQGRIIDEIVNQIFEGELIVNYDVSQLASGAYFIHVSQGNRQWVQKQMIGK